MSTSVSACLIVGMPVDELGWDLDFAALAGMETFQPYYDASMADSLVGMVVQCSPEYGYVAAPEKYKFDEAVSIVFAKFLALTGKVGKLYLTPKVY